MSLRINHAGERCFDFANIFCNPDANIANAPGRLRRQVVVISEAAQLDGTPLIAWIATWSALSAVWLIADNKNPDSRLAVAETAPGYYRQG